MDSIWLSEEPFGKTPPPSHRLPGTNLSGSVYGTYRKMYLVTFSPVARRNGISYPGIREILVEVFLRLSHLKNDITSILSKLMPDPECILVSDMKGIKSNLSQSVDTSQKKVLIPCVTLVYLY